MAFYTGKTGSVQFDSKTVLKMRDWSLESTVELLSTNVLGSFANTFVPGIKGATGSATVLYYRKESSDKVSEKDFQSLLQSTGILKKGDIDTSKRVEFTLNVATDNADPDKDSIKFDGYITSAGLTVATGEVSSVAINFTVDGDFKEVLAST